jgi:UDP-GlcNAc:undecaprenyl-phosphate GlcNAc-1-phosphate transferase
LFLHNALALLLSVVLGLGLTALVIKVSRKYGWLDMPTDERRIHSTPIPRLGGVAIFLSTVLTVGAVYVIDWIRIGAPPSLPLGPLLPGILLGATIVFVTGLVDDIRGVAPHFKLVAQTAAALIVVAYGFPPTSIALSPSGAAIQFGGLAVPIAIFWIVGVTNAFNLIDGVDGLAGTFALIGLACCAAAEALIGGPTVLTVSMSIAGAVLAFLRYNNSPARIFLGDSGSMTIGFFLAVRTVVGATSADGNVVYFLIPLVALAFPITDTFVAIARRWVRGHPLSRADGRHVHHQLLALGLSPARTVDVLGLVFAAFAAMGFSIVFAPPQLTLALMVAGGSLGFAILLYASRYLRYSEFIQFGASVMSVLRSARAVVRHKVLAEELALRIERATTLGEVERLLDEFGGTSGIVQVELLAGRRNYIGPEGQMISPADALPWRLDYRIGLGDEQRREMLLRVWCNAPSPGTSHGSAERFAMRVGPAVERWVLANAGQFPEHAEPHSEPKERVNRISGEQPRQVPS